MEKIRVTELMSKPGDDTASEDTVMIYELGLNVEVNCGDLARFLNKTLNSKKFHKEVRKYGKDNN